MTKKRNTSQFSPTTQRFIDIYIYILEKHGGNKISRDTSRSSKNRFVRAKFFSTTKSSGSYCVVRTARKQRYTRPFAAYVQLLARNTVGQSSLFHQAFDRVFLFFFPAGWFETWFLINQKRSTIRYPIDSFECPPAIFRRMETNTGSVAGFINPLSFRRMERPLEAVNNRKNTIDRCVEPISARV